MIYTVTLNPSIDYIVHMDSLEIGQVNRMKYDSKFPGGKGINVSRILNRLGQPTCALGFLGGFTGEFISEWLKKEQLQHHFTHIQEDTRINIKLKEKKETEINGIGPFVSTKEQEELFSFFHTLTPKDIVVFSGSKPKGVKPTIYEELIDLVKEKKAQFVIDTTGKELMNALSYCPLVVKPNHHELAEVFQTTFNTIEAIYPYGKKLLEKGAQYALVSLAEKGALFFTSKGIYRATPLKGKVKNSVGAGDSMIAGFVGAYSQTQDPLESFALGVACGSATAFSNDLATKEKIEEVVKDVVIEKVKEEEEK